MRWAGSKRKLLPELLQCVPTEYGRYIEPFSGSACLFFALRPRVAVLSDLNRELIDTYRALRLHPRLIYRAVAAMPKTKAYYYSLRNAGTFGLDQIAKAARFIYLNRNCFNGVFRMNRKGQFNVPRGRDAGAIPNQTHFLRCSYALRKASLLHGDFERVVKQARPGDFVYLDPPYAKQGARRRGEYGYASFDTPDVKRLATCLQDLDQNGVIFLLSYADCREIRDISSDWYSRRILVRRHVAGFLRHRTIVREVLISNRELKRQMAPKPCLQQ